MSSPRSVLRALAFLLPALAISLAFAGSAGAERPGWWSIPTIENAKAEVGAVLHASDGSLNCTPGCGPAGPEPDKAGRFFEWLSCTGTSGGGADRPTGGLEHDPRPAGGCIVRSGPSKTALTYTVQVGDLGRYIQLHVIATNYDCGEVRKDNGTQECNYSSGHGWSKTLGPIGGSLATGPVASALPAISGVARDGETLTASNGSWLGSPTGFAYQWRRCAAACTAIAGATSSTYALGADDIGNRMQVVVSATNAQGTNSAQSPLTDVVAAVAPANTERPALEGIVEDLQTLKVSSGTWRGTAPITYSYEWFRCSTRLKGCVAIAGATTDEYRVVREDIGARFVVTVTATNRAGSSKASTLRTTRVVGAKPRPGSEVLDVSQIVAPNVLRVAVVTRSASVVRPGGQLVLTIAVTDRRGFRIEGARVRLTGARSAPVVTDEDGYARLRVRAGRVLGKSILTLTATKPGDATVTGTKLIALTVRA